MDQTNGLLWALVRLDMKFECLLKTLEQEKPDFAQRVKDEIDKQRKLGLVGLIAQDTREQIEKANDGIWLLQHGISESENPPTDEQKPTD